MGKEKIKTKNIEEEKRLGENSLRKLVEAYSYNTVVDQFFMRTSKKIVEIDKILRNLKNKTGSAFVSKFLYDNKEELANAYKCSSFPCTESTSFLENSEERKFLNKKRKMKINDQEKGGSKTFLRKRKNLTEKENKIKRRSYRLNLRSSNGKKNKDENKNDIKSNEKYIYTHLLLNSYANINPLEYQPNKTINERAESMRKKILNFFPEIDKNKVNEIQDIEEQKKKELFSCNESHSTKESEINAN